MSLFSEWARRVAYLFNRRRHEAALAEEMAEHRSRMNTPVRFGNELRLREESRDAWGWRWIDDLARDTRLAGRLLGRSPGYSVVVVMSLSLAFVLVAGAIAVVNAYLLRPLPYDAANLYHVRYAPPGPWEPNNMQLLDWASVKDVVEHPITATGDTLYLEDGAYAQAARTLRATPGFVEGLGLRALAGRVLDARDWQSDSDLVGMIGHGFWRDRYASDPAIIGRVIRAASEAGRGRSETVRIVGVLPPDFYFGRDSSAKVDVLVPFSGRARTYLVRLRDGVPPELAARRLTDAARLVSTDIPAEWTGVMLDSAHERYVADLRPIVIGVAGTAGAILILVCTNVGVLTLLRTMRREKEMAVRSALGSGRWRIARMLTIEGVLLSGAALALGVGGAALLLRVLGPIIETRMGRPAPNGVESLAIDGTVVSIVAAISIGVALSFGPWQRRVFDALRRDRGFASDSLGTRRLRSTLLALQVAGTLILVAAGALLVQSLTAMVRTDLGFEKDRLVRARFVLRGADYADGPSFYRFFEAFAANATLRLGAPVAYSSWPPFAALPTLSAETQATVNVGVPAGYVRVSGGYFQTMGIAIRRGRDMTADDVRENAAVAVVSESLARKLWPNENALGQTIRGVEETTGGRTPGPWRTVVGVVADVRQGYFDRDVSDVYFPQDVASAGRYGIFYVRTDRGPGEVWPVLRAVATELDRNAVVNEPARVTAQNVELEGATFVARAISVVAIGALGLAMLGIYGVTAYVVGQRARDIAVRMALGASGRSIERLFLSETGAILLAGAVLGVAGVFLLARFAGSWLYGLAATDATTLISVSAVVGAVGLLAAWRPVRRASTIDPMTILKEG